MAHDPTTDTVVLFGGNTVFGSGGPADTWTWDGGGWTPAEGPGPPGTFAPVMAHDAVNDKVLLAAAPGGPTGRLQTWSFDGPTRTWAQEQPAVSPPNRQYAAMAADGATGTVVLFGGRGIANSVDLDDTWIWDGATKVWIRQPVATSPPAGGQPTMAYDPVSRRVVLFGLHGETWTWDGTAKVWTREAVDGGPPMSRPAMAFHEPSQRLVLHGHGDTWLWDGATRRWTRATPVVRPPPRGYTAMAGGDGDAAVLFGGQHDWRGGPLGDTWTWDGRSWTEPGEPVAGPVVAVGDATVVEGNAGTRKAVFTVSLSEFSASTVTVDYATGDGTADAAPQEGPRGDDYVAKVGTLSFAPGVTALNVKVPVNGDFDSPNQGGDATKELFVLNLSGANGATIGDHLGLGTILDDEPAAGLYLAIGDAAVYEGNTGSRAAVFNVSLSAPSPYEVTVAYATVMDTTKANDLTSVSGTLTFPPGTTSNAIKVPVAPDTRVEPDESFTLRLFNARSRLAVSIHRGTGTGTVLADDM